MLLYDVAHIMLAHGYMYIALLLDDFMQRNGDMMPQQLPGTPAVTGLSHVGSHGGSVTPQASLQAPGSGTGSLPLGSAKQPSVAPSPAA